MLLFVKDDNRRRDEYYLIDKFSYYLEIVQCNHIWLRGVKERETSKEKKTIKETKRPQEKNDQRKEKTVEEERWIT